jgi:threonine aldolase
MNFGSDNWSGVCPEIMEALRQASGGYAVAYGLDHETAALERKFGDVFERDVKVFPVITGTAANALALAVLTPPWGIILCHEDSHVYNDENGAPELFAGGARSVALPGPGGKIDHEALVVAARRTGHGVHTMPAKVLTISQATEWGTVYTATELQRLSGIAHEHGLGCHMDGARFANAVASLGCAPADITWRAGVDVLSFGATKNGAMGAEAVVFFEPDHASEIERHRKRGGHLLSKMRFVSAQLRAYLEGDLWLENARAANRMAARLSAGLAEIEGVRLSAPVEANEVFAVMPARLTARMHERGARFHSDPVDEPGASEPMELARMVASFCTTERDVDGVIGLARELAG